MIDSKKPKLNIALYILTLVAIIVLIVVLLIMYKYKVEGETIPPFKISKMIVVSTAKTQEIQKEEDVYNANIIQNNDIKISIEKNPKYKKEAIIKKITINNIQIDKKNCIGDIEIYRPSMGTKLYDYEDKYKINDTIEYVGKQETYLKNEELEISNQGGIIEFSVILNNIGNIKYAENEQIKVDGTLLNQLELKQEQLEFEIKFDLIVELQNGTKLKTKITLQLPTGSILVNGVETLEQTEMKTIFKRI